MSKIRFSDKSRYPTPYVRAEHMGENYLRDKFAAIRAKQEADAAEAKEKTRPMRKKEAA